MAIDAIYIDLDNTLADWLRGVCSLLGLDLESVMQQWPEGVYDFSEATKTSRDELWAKIAEHGVPWWESLPLLEGAKQLVGLCSRYGHVYCVSDLPEDPLHRGLAAHGKNLFIQRHHLPPMAIGLKEAMARVGTVLIDDNESRVEDFKRAGGAGIIYAQPWNRERSLASDLRGKLALISRRLDALKQAPRW